VTAISTLDLYRLDRACEPIWDAYGGVYLVGTAGKKGNTYRDVDVRCIVDDTQFDQMFPTVEIWQAVSLGIGSWLQQQTGLPVDFQFQRRTQANARHPGGGRNPVGMGSRILAGGGDGTAFLIGQCQSFQGGITHVTYQCEKAPRHKGKHMRHWGPGDIKTRWI
jgi:hypothetical protein